MLALLLVQKIASLFMIMAVGFALVRAKVLKSEQSAVLSKVLLYAVGPCAIISAFQVELKPEVVAGFGLACACGLGVQLGQMLIVELIARPLRLSRLEKMVSIYSNTGNLILPLVGYCLGDEWLIYALAYNAIQTLFMWTHGKALIGGRDVIDLKKLLMDVNVIALAAGFVLFITGIRLVGPIEVFVTDMGKMIGPVAMLITGMIVGGMELPRIVSNKRVWLATFIRLVFLPALVCLALRFVAGLDIVPDSQSVLMIVLLGAVTPTASMSVVFSQEYGTEAEYASAINIISTISCIVTMPIWVYLFML